VDKNKQLIDDILALTLILDRVAYSLTGDIRQRLRELENDIASVLAANFPRGFVLAQTRLRFMGTLDQIRSLIKTAMADLNTDLNDDLEQVALEAKKRQRVFLLAILGSGVFSHFLSDQDVKDLITTLTIQGGTLLSWWGKFGDNLNFQIANQIRMGAASSETLSQVLDRVIGNVATNNSNPLQRAGQAGEMLTRTATLGVGNSVLIETMKLNGHAISGMQQISVLDNRTSQICIAYAYKIWDLDGKPIGHDLPFNGGPPRHFNCRSIIVPVALDDGSVMNYDVTEWLDRQSNRTQNQLIGKGKAELFRAGKIGINDLVDQSGHPLRLQDFAAGKN
jgi:hypothetical protein